MTSSFHVGLQFPAKVQISFLFLAAQPPRTGQPSLYSCLSMHVVTELLALFLNLVIDHHEPRSRLVYTTRSSPSGQKRLRAFS